MKLIFRTREVQWWSLVGILVYAFSGVLATINPEYAHLLDVCVEQNMTAVLCKEMLAENNVKVLLVHPRTENDVFYNQVVVTVDYMGNVLGGSTEGGAYDGVVEYPFMWRSKPLWHMGERLVGPWNCTNLKATDCCYKIEEDVVDRDIHNKLIDCWLVEAKIKDEHGSAVQVYKDMEDGGKVKPLTKELLDAFEAHENQVRIKLMEDILQVLGSQYILKSAAWSLLGRIREAIRGIERAEAYSYQMKNQIRQVFDKKYVPMNGVMQYMFLATFKVLTELWVSGGREKMRARDGNLLILQTDNVDWDITDTLKFENYLKDMVAKASHGENNNALRH
jgi:hypothetical protein